MTPNTRRPRTIMNPAEIEPDATEPVDHAGIVPEQLLQPNEIIILCLKPSAWFIILASLRELFIVGGFFIVAMVLQHHDQLIISRRDVIIIFIVLLALILFWRFLDWLARVYILTDRRIVRIKGVLRVQVFETQLKQIQHTDTIFTLRERLFGLGSIGFATAGTGVVDAYWLMLANPLEVHRRVVQAINRYR